MTETAVLGGGCFWCTEAVFARLKGVKSVKPGYAGGRIPYPTYDHVSSGKTGHAEVIKVEFDPTIISFEQLLEVFFATHDPTSVNRQGADVGTQYRSIVFFMSDSQREVARRLIQPPMVTEVLPMEEFYPAEDYHKNILKITCLLHIARW